MVPEDMTTSREAARKVVCASLEHLTGLIRPDGKFVYAHSADDPEDDLGGYNMLRHCGTVWFMLRAINGLDLKPGVKDRKVIGAAIAYALGKMKRPKWVFGDDPCLCIVTKGAVKLGGVGLALVMLAEVRAAGARLGPQGKAAVPDVDARIAGLQSYALLQIDGADFFHKRDFVTGEVLPFRSDYYTGEALLGLLVSECRDPVIAPQTLGLLTSGYGVDFQSHWMAYAACEAFERKATDSNVTRGYIEALVGHIVQNPRYRARRESTPIACRTEALTRFLLLAAKHQGAFSAALVQAAEEATRDNLGFQLQWYKNGQFWKSDDDRRVQIDYIQHNATAFLNWHQYLAA